MSTYSNTPATGQFAPTRWTLVLQARGNTDSAKVALSELCGLYYQPVYRFLVCEGRSEESARELVQEFFVRLLARDPFASVDRTRGRFRSYLLGALRHFLSDLRDRDKAIKRGEGAVPEPLGSETDATEGPPPPGSAAEPNDMGFDRQWALSIMDRSLTLLAAEYKNADKELLFGILKPWLMGEAAESQLAAATKLGWSEGALKVAVHRLRKRFRELVRTDVAQTVPEFSDVDSELSYLVDVLANFGKLGVEKPH